MLDVGWTELVVIAIVLIIVVGPKDLPPMLRTFGKMMSKMRGMAADFRSQFDEALREADLDDVRKTISDAQKLNPANSLREAMNPLRQMGNDIKADLQKATRPDEKKPELPPEPELPPAPEMAASVARPIDAAPSAAPTVAAAVPSTSGGASPVVSEVAAAAAPMVPEVPSTPDAVAKPRKRTVKRAGGDEPVAAPATRRRATRLAETAATNGTAAVGKPRTRKPTVRNGAKGPDAPAGDTLSTAGPQPVEQTTASGTPKTGDDA
jgi:sec-independent protein translocase protein TatB